jgi:hypothetical protein
MSRFRAELPFLARAGMRLLAILFIGFLMVLWFQGCFVPMARDEMRQEQEKHWPEKGP